MQPLMFLIVNIGPDGPRVSNEGIGSDIILLVLHIDMVTGNSLLDAWCQQDSSQLKNFSKNPCRIKDSSFLEVYNLGLNSTFSQSTLIKWCSKYTHYYRNYFMFNSFNFLTRSWYFHFYFIILLIYFGIIFLLLF